MIQESSTVNNGPFSLTGEETPKDVRTSTVVYETERERAREREGEGGGCLMEWEEDSDS